MRGPWDGWLDKQDESLRLISGGGSRDTDLRIIQKEAETLAMSVRMERREGHMGWGGGRVRTKTFRPSVLLGENVGDGRRAEEYLGKF